MDQAVTELLEQEERKALAKQQQQQQQQQRHAAPRHSSDSRDRHAHRRRRRNTSSDEDDDGGDDDDDEQQLPEASRPAGAGAGRDAYSAEREENNERRARRTRDAAMTSDGAPASANGHSDGHNDREMEDAHARPSSANGSVRSGTTRRRSRSPPDHDRRRDREYRDRRDPRRSVDRDDDDRYYRPIGRDHPRRDHDRRDPRGSPRERGGGAGRDIDRAYGGGGRDRRRSPPPPHHRRRSPPPRHNPKAKTPEPTDDERDRRTVFVQQLAARLRTKELQAFFEQVGPVVEAQIVKDRVSGRSKGVGYVEFKDEESVQKAIQLTGQKLLGIPIIAQLTEAEKNRQARNTEGTATQSNGIPFHRLYVGNIHFSITEEDLKNVFEPFGELEFVQLQKEEMGRSKGYGFVQFIDPAQAKEALEKMNGFELAGRPIRVGLGNDKFTPESTQSLLQRFGNQAHNAAAHPQNSLQQQGSSFSGMGGRGAHAGGTGNFDRASGRNDAEKMGGGASALDDTDVAGVNFSNYSRDALMRKLARVEEPSTTTTTSSEDSAKTAAAQERAKRAAAAAAAATAHESPAPSRCVLLKNMYNPAEETEPNWQKELEEDVRLECEDKYGHVVHIGLALDSNEGEIYVKFDRVQGGENAIRGLNGRWFGGRMITAQFVVEAVYLMNFPKSGNV